MRDERANFKQKLEEQVSDIRREIVIRKSDNKSATNFKYSGCKNQLEFNSQRISELQLADDYLRIGRIEDASEILKQAKNKLSERNTHVKIVDKYGWDTLEEYLGDDLIDGPDEVAKLRKAESRAIKRRKESKDKKPYDKNDSGPSALMRNDLFRVDNTEAVRQYFNTGYGYPQSAPGSCPPRIWSGPQPNTRFNYPKSTVCCYCFNEGHVSTQCPLKLQQGTGRVSMPTATISNPETDKKSK